MDILKDKLGKYTGGKILDVATGYESFVHENKNFNQYVSIDMFKERYRNFVEKVKECPEYEKYRLEFESLAARLDNVGVEFASQLMIIGRK